MRRREALVGVLFGLVLGTGYLAVRSAPDDGHVIGIWPVGVATAILFLLPHRRGVAAAGALVVTLAAFGTISVAGRPADVAVGYAVGIGLACWLASQALLDPDGGPPRLRNDDDLRRYFAACCGSTFVAAAVSATTSSAAGYGEPWRVALGIGAAHLASQLTVVPVFLRLPGQGAIAGRGERVLQWATIVLGTPLVFLTEAAPSLVFLTIPILVWGALRITPLEAVAQMLAVVGLAIVLTTGGNGPFADAPARYGLETDMRGVLLSAFAATCAVIVVPCVLRVGEYVGAAQASSAERDLVRGIVDGATGVAIIGTDPLGRITLFNPGAEQLLGYRADEVLGLSTEMLHRPEAIRDEAAELDVAADLGSVATAMMERGLVGFPVRLLRKDGVERTHAMTLTRLTVAGRTSGFVSTSEDVTEQLDLEQALRDALDVERQAVERLRDVDAVKDQFVSTVSHELRTPITSILGYLEMLADGTLGDLDGAQVDALKRVQSNSHRLLALIDDLLALSRVAEKGLRSNEEPFDLRDAVRTAYDVVSPAWEAPRHLVVTLAVPEAPVSTYGDREMVERVVVNLVGNAVKFTDDGGAVEVDLHVDDGAGQSVLRVVDTGIGIPEEEQAQLFTRFFRSSLAERRAIPGSGLGLSITQAVVEQHGGSIGVTSTPGEGTTVEVRLPVHQGMSKIQLPLDPSEPGQTV